MSVWRITIVTVPQRESPAVHFLAAPQKGVGESR
jgi:hypothetical protein